ncbi:MAG: ATP-binding protein, partial [Anaerolineales bacterium]
VRRFRLDRAWNHVAIGLGLWALGTILALVVRLVTQSAEPLPSLADWLAFSGSLAVLAGLASLSRRSTERFGRVRGLLDLVIIALALGSLAWLVFVRTIFGTGLAEPIRMVWATATPVLDLILAGWAVKLTLSAQRDRDIRPFALLALGLLIFSIAELGDALRRLQDESMAGGMVEAGWIAAGIVFMGVASSLAKDRGDGRQLTLRRAYWLETVLPIALTYVVVGTVLVDWWLSKQVDWLAVVAAGVLSLLLMARQGIIIGQVEMRQYAALVNASADLSLVSDADGKLLLANPALREAMDLTIEETSIVEVFDLGEYPESILKQALKSGWEGEVAVRSPNFPVNLALRPVQDERRTRPLLAGTAHDLRIIKQRETELEAALAGVAAARSALEELNRELEGKVNERTRQLEQTILDLAHLNEELEELDRLKNEFVALVSHELLTPLTNIRTGLELLLESEPEMSAEATGSLELVQEEANRLSHLVEAILDLSALEARRFPLHLATVDLNQVTREVLAQFPDIEAVRTEIPEDLPLIVADERSLKSVLTHLLDNAAKYAPGSDLQIRAEVENGSIKVTLSDSGPGIPPEERDRIFEMFHRLDGSDSREVYGYGLGLPMSRRLIEAMGGELQVGEAAEEGAEFAFWLPQAGGN